MTSPAAGGAEALVGAWRLVGCTLTDGEGRVTRPYGTEPNGAILYTPDGWMACHMEPGGVVDEPSFGQSSYFASVTVRPEAGVVVHHVEGSSTPFVAGDQIRHYRFEGALLHLEAEANGLQAHLVWRRADAH